MPPKLGMPLNAATAEYALHNPLSAGYAAMLPTAECALHNPLLLGMLQCSQLLSMPIYTPNVGYAPLNG